jgi:anaerobic ribonucleoside-triphosphate reductase activating protein
MMLRLASYDIVFQEIPGEVTLALNISGCPNACPGCHSPHLQTDAGKPLDDTLSESLLERYGANVTCVCLMGGDIDPAAVAALAGRIRERGLKTAWYSGRETLPEGFPAGRLDYLKLGPYRQALGGLRSPRTNQRLYRRNADEWEDITCLFQK